MRRFIIFICLSLWLAGPADAMSTCVVQDARTLNCREVTSVMYSGEYQQKGNGAACLQSDGLWKVVSGPGFGMSFSGRNATVAYLGGSYMVNNVYYEQPTKIQFSVEHNSVCVPAMPIELERPILVAPVGIHPPGATYPGTRLPQTIRSSNGGNPQ